MQMTKTVAMMIATAFLCLSSNVAFAEVDGDKLFKKKCRVCHKIDKKGMGPSVITMNTDSTVLKSAIIDGRKAMPSFDKKLDADQIDALLAFIQSRQVKLNPCTKNP
jgi:mono/diheme cytochrome c family protein